jgi:hypothetical protein
VVYVHTLDASVVNAPKMVSINEHMINHVCSNSGDACWYAESEALNRTHCGPLLFELVAGTSFLL